MIDFEMELNVDLWGGNRTVNTVPVFALDSTPIDPP